MILKCLFKSVFEVVGLHVGGTMYNKHFKWCNIIYGTSYVNPLNEYHCMSVIDL